MGARFAAPTGVIRFRHRHRVLSNLGLAFAIGGFVAPAIGGQLLGWRGVVPVAWFVLGAGLHVSAQIVLGRMKP